MKNSYCTMVVRIFLIFLAGSSWVMLPMGSAAPTQNYYQAIGIEDYKERLKNAQDAVEQDATVVRLKNDIQRFNDRLNAIPDSGLEVIKDLDYKLSSYPRRLYKRLTTTRKPEVAELQKKIDKAYGELLARRKEIIQPFSNEEIKKACQKSREVVREQLDKAQEKMEGAQDFERAALYKELKKVQAHYRLIGIACSVLMDPKKRAEYNNQLRLIQAQAYQLPGGENYFNEMQATIANAIPEKTVLLNQIVGELLSQIEIPGPAAKIFNQNLQIRSLSFLPMSQGPDIKYGIGFSGLIALNNFDVRMSVYIIQDIYGDRKWTMSVDLPEQYKVTDLFASLTMLDSFKFPQAKFIMANFDGSDKDGFPFKKGFNFGAVWDIFSGPFEVINDLKTKAPSLKSLVFENKPIILSGVLPGDPKALRLNLTKLELSAMVPLRIGVDLREIPVIPKILSNVINRVTTGDLELDVLPVAARKEKLPSGQTKEYPRELPIKSVQQNIPFVVEDTADPTIVPDYTAYTTSILKLGYRVQGEWGFRIDLGTQPDPIKLNALVVLIPVSKDHPEGMISASLLMKNMLELKWLALGNVALSFDWDGALMPAAAAVGLPFTGIGIRGDIDLGAQGDTRAKFKAAGGFRVSGSATPIDLVLDLSAENIRFANIVSYATGLATKAKILKSPVSLERIPFMTLHKVWGYCAFKDTTIAGRPYNAGIGLQAEFEFFDKKAGAKIYMDDKYKVSGWGYMPAVNWSVKGKEVFSLSGVTTDKGPRLSLSLDPAQPLKGSFGLQGQVVVPAMNLKQKVDFSWAGSTLNADFETKLANFSLLLGIRMNTQEGAPAGAYANLRDQVMQQFNKADPIAVDKLAMRNLLDESDSLAMKNDYKGAIALLQKAQEKLKVTQGSKVIPSRKVIEGQLAIADFKKELIKAESLQAVVDTLSQMVIKRSSDSPLDSRTWSATFNQGSTALQKGKDILRTVSIEEIERLAADRAPDIAISPEQRTENIEQMFQEVSQAAREKLNQAIVQFEGAQRIFMRLIPSKQKAFEAQFKKMLEEQKKQKNVFPLRQKLDNLLERWGARGIAEADRVEDWGAVAQKVDIKFGFKGDFATFLNKNAVQVLAKIRDNALAKLDALNEKVAQFATTSVDAGERETERVREVIAKLSADIDAMQSSCSSLPLYKQVGCRIKIKIAQTKLLSKKGYLNLLLRPGKQAVRSATGAAASITKAITQSQRVRAATEAVLSAATAGMEMLAQGLSMINVTEARGEYNWADMKALKLPKLVTLVAQLELPEDILPPMQIVLSDLQFDFKNPVQSATLIVQKIMMSMIEGQQNKYMRYAIALSE